MQRGNEPCSAAIESREVRGAYRAVVPRFTGKAGEYLRIWIVDTALTLLTFGVFSPWAAVRTRRYFARNTFVDGASFDYVGRPTAIACRRLVAVGLLSALLLASHHSFGIHWGLIAAAAFSTSWLLLGSRALELHNLRYRQVAFRFDGSSRDVWVECARAAILMLASLGLAHPYVVFSLHRYLVTRRRWDGLRFDWHVYATNSLAVIASFGLLIPWAKVRVAAHEVSRVTLHVRR